MSELFLGLDCSTQSLTAIIINNSKILFRTSVNFDKDLPHYETQNGVVSLGNKKVIHSYPLMWIEALELIFKDLKENEIELQNIKAVSGSGQQHGTVYLNSRFEENLKNLLSDIPLKSQLKDCFTRKTAPIWMDSSTSQQCDEIRTALGGMENTIRITGSNTFERFSGPQIRKFYQEEPGFYSNTSIIHLVSSFIASVLIGKNAPIDYGDGSGMNLMNIKTQQWDERALDATAPNLINKLPSLTNSFEIIGNISGYFQEKYGFSPETSVIAWSGDNPNSLIGTGLISEGKVAISLGTSDTYFGYIKSLVVDYTGEGHVFGAPTGDYMSLICYKNGSLAREKVREKYNLEWGEFSEILEKTPPGNHGKLMLPYFLPEIVPHVLEPKIYRFGFDEADIEGNVRAIIEAQFLSMRIHSEWIGEKPLAIYATGGASKNISILKIAANIFNTPIYKFEVSDSAALGAAMRAEKSYYTSINIQKSWNDLIQLYLNLDESKVILPDDNLKELYDMMTELYKMCEGYVLRKEKDPEPFRQQFIKKFPNFY